MRRILCHISVCVGIITLVLVIPLLSSDKVRAFISGDGIDAKSSASVVLDKPSGAYTVLINKAYHTDDKTLSLWRDFFMGREVPVIFEDIVCYVGNIDVSGMDMAKSLCQRLPENQMQIESEDVTLILSKAEYGKFDVILISDEVKDKYPIDDIIGDPMVDMIHIV